MEMLGIPPEHFVKSSKRRLKFFTPCCDPLYVELTELANGSMGFGGGRSKSGKYRGPPGSRPLETVLQNHVGR